MQYWKILRILTTDACNYKCVYCHNEGQEKIKTFNNLLFDDFLALMQGTKDSGIEEVRFSGGEPLMNKETLKMIEWVDKNTDYEVGLATNASLITEEIAQRLSKTRVMITIHFPGATKDTYKKITANEYDRFRKNLLLLDKYRVDYSFNFVLHSSTDGHLDDVLEYAISNKKRVKILPFIDKDSDTFLLKNVEKINERLSDCDCEKVYDDEKGFYIWTFKNGGQIKILNSPCLRKDIRNCKEYGELRVLPGLRFKKCIFGEEIPVVSKDLGEMREQIDNLWNGFCSCERGKTL